MIDRQLIVARSESESKEASPRTFDPLGIAVPLSLATSWETIPTTGIPWLAMVTLLLNRTDTLVPAES